MEVGAAEKRGTGYNLMAEQVENRQNRIPAAGRGSIWRRPLVLFVTAFFCCTLWGSASPAIKIGYELFAVGADDTPARILFAGCRFVIAGIMVIAAGSLLERRFLHPTRQSFRYVLLLGCFQTVVQYTFFYMALAHTSGVRGSIINAAGTFFSIFLAVYVFRFEKMTLRKLLGSVVGFIGVVMVITGGSVSSLGGQFSLQGEGAMLLAAFSSAAAGCLIKLFSAREDPVTMSGYQFLIGGLVMVILGLLLSGRIHIVSSASMPLLVYMGFISAGAYTLWGILLQYNPVSTVTVLGFINPVMGVLLSVIFLHENSEILHWNLLAALLLVCLGICIVNYQKKPAPYGE